MERENYFWCREKGEQLSIQYEKALSLLSSYFNNNKSYKKALFYLDKTIEQNIFNDDAHNMIMSIYKQIEDKEAYLKYSNWINKIYNEELGIDFKEII